MIQNNAMTVCILLDFLNHGTQQKVRIYKCTRTKSVPHKKIHFAVTRSSEH